MLMLELVEAMRGRLIGPKTWDRIVWIYGTQIYSPWLLTDCLGGEWCDSCHGLCGDVCKAGVGRDIRVH